MTGWEVPGSVPVGTDSATRKVVCSANTTSINTLAHEIGHVLGWTHLKCYREILNSDGTKSYFALRSRLNQAEALSFPDYNNGSGVRYYDYNTSWAQVLIRMVMAAGVKIDDRIDIPLGSVRGYVRQTSGADVFGWGNIGLSGINRSLLDSMKEREDD